MKTYVVSDEGKLIEGTAENILNAIKSKSSDIDNDIASMDLDKYVGELIKNARFFLAQATVADITQRHYDNDYDKALSLLSAMPTSGTHIIG